MLCGVCVLVLVVCVGFARFACDVWRDGVWLVLCVCCWLCVLVFNMCVRCVYGLRCAAVWFAVCAGLQLCVWVVMCL